MEEKNLLRFRSILKRRLDALTDTAIESRNGMTEGVEAQPDLNDQATVELNRAFDMRIRGRERNLIRKIQKALDRITEGTYGICESCGDPISEKRLEARPVTGQCIDCKLEAERIERGYYEE